jgi:hypothetical protein
MSVDACARRATSQRQGETVDHASFMKIIDINVIPRIFVSRMLIDWEGTAALSFAIPGLLDAVQVRPVEGGGIEDLAIILRGSRAVFLAARPVTFRIPILNVKQKKSTTHTGNTVAKTKLYNSRYLLIVTYLTTNLLVSC